jgi:large subunit ribosomal protein L40e
MAKSLDPEIRHIVETRRLSRKICMHCYARNPIKAKQCRRCGYKGLRVKAKESRGG